MLNNTVMLTVQEIYAILISKLDGVDSVVVGASSEFLCLRKSAIHKRAPLILFTRLRPIPFFDDPTYTF